MIFGLKFLKLKQSLRLPSHGIIRNFWPAKNFDQKRTHETIKQFHSVYTDFKNQVEFLLFSVVLPSAHTQSITAQLSYHASMQTHLCPTKIKLVMVFTPYRSSFLPYRSTVWPRVWNSSFRTAKCLNFCAVSDVPCEQNKKDEFSTSGKFVRCHVTHAYCWLSKSVCLSGVS